MGKRFNDENKTLSHFYDEIWVVCPNCKQKAIAEALREEKKAKLYCPQCGYNKVTATNVGEINYVMSAHFYFDIELWLQHPFRNEVFYAYNAEHLKYLKNYIGADLREHKNRTKMTLLERLPKFYHESKNRAALLKIISKLEKKFKSIN